jgi:electron transport complex protein RnfC
MLITELKSKEAISALVNGKVFIVNCHGCKEVHFPEAEADELQKEMMAAGNVTGIITTDYICNPDNMKLRLSKHAAWAEGLKQQYTFTADNAMDIILQETGKVFAAVLEDAGVYKRTEEGQAAFGKFVEAVNNR